jgi:hypothetical protein
MLAFKTALMANNTAMFTGKPKRYMNHIGGIMVRVLVSSAVNRGFDQLYHGENNLFFYEMMMMGSALF